MKQIISHCAVLLVGVIAGGALCLLIRLHQKEDTSAFIDSRVGMKAQTDRTVAKRTKESTAAADAYFTDKTPVPIPASVDFSSNTWQRLNYWGMFTRSFLWYQSPLDLSHVSLVAYAPKTDPWDAVPDFEASSQGPSGLAMEALQRLRKGESFDSVRNWVGEHAEYADRSRFDSYARAITNEYGRPQQRRP
jgi:hypothetical protein